MDQLQQVSTTSHPLRAMATLTTGIRNAAKLLLLLNLFASLVWHVNASELAGSRTCLYNGKEFADLAHWQADCQDCTCLDSIPVCREIQCKYEPCTDGKVLVLNEDQCCPSCQVSKKSCHYEQYLIEVIFILGLLNQFGVT